MDAKSFYDDIASSFKQVWTLQNPFGSTADSQSHKATNGRAITILTIFGWLTPVLADYISRLLGNKAALPKSVALTEPFALVLRGSSQFGTF